MADTPLTLTADERKFLADLLQHARMETLVEEHRTRTPSFRELVQQRGAVINALLAKLGQPPA
jgi:hypothetical protein